MSDWGKGAKNNTIGWGQGACDNTIGWGTSQKDNNSWSGDTDISGCSGAAGLAQINNLNSMSFDGTSDFIKADGIGSLMGNSTNKLSFSCWVKIPDNLVSADGVFAIATDSYMANQGTINKGFQFTIAYSAYPTGVTFFDVQLDHYRLTRFSPIIYPDNVPITKQMGGNVYNHIAMVYDGTIGVNNSGNRSSDPDRLKLYINGIRLTSISIQGSNPDVLPLTEANLFIGKSKSSPSFLNGNINEFALWKASLTESEILSIYNATAVVDGVNKTADLSELTTPPVAWYRM